MNIEKAFKVFDEYVEKFDLADPKIRIKYIHTYEVVKISDYLAKKLDLSPEETDLAKLIALLHDIGRFEQVRMVDSFDDQKIDHAKLAIKILFDDEMIREFIKEDKYDKIIKEAISYHSIYKLPETLEKQSLLQAKIIRDSDKLDNFRVKQVDKIEIIYGVDEETFCQLKASDKVYQDILNYRLIHKEDRSNAMDRFLSMIAFIFDLNFKESYQWILDRNYLYLNFHRFPIKDSRVKELEKICQKYIVEKAKSG